MLAYDVPFTIDTSLKIILDIHRDRFGEKLCSKDIIDSANNLRLTTVETEVLFCICSGIRTRKSIAEFLTIIYKSEIRADTTVNDAIRRLCDKLDCNSVGMLADFAVANGLHQTLPRSFLSRHGSYELNSYTPIIR